MFNGFAEVAAFCAVVELLSVVPVALATVPFLRALKAGGRSPAREVTLALLAVLVTVVAMSLGAIELLYVLCVIRSHALGQPFASALVEFGRILHMAVTESEARSIILATGGVAALATFVAFVACRRGGAVPKIGALAVTIGAIVAVILVAPDSDVQGIVGVGSGLGAGVLIAVEAGALLRRIVARRFAALR
ncbi:MAG: hypothetical protein ACAI25_15505 [Planctomycetota bacterium]